MSTNLAGALKGLVVYGKEALDARFAAKADQGYVDAAIATRLPQPVVLTQADYDALPSPDPSVLYLITN